MFVWSILEDKRRLILDLHRQAMQHNDRSGKNRGRIHPFILVASYESPQSGNRNSERTIAQ